MVVVCAINSALAIISCYPHHGAAEQKIAKWVCQQDGPGPRGVKYKTGVPRQTWQAIAELGQYNYAMEESDQAGVATR